MPIATLGKWGNSLGLRIPGDVAAAARLAAGDAVEVEAHGDTLIIRSATPRFSATDLFRGRTAAEWRAVYTAAFDWGDDVGREVVPD